MFYVSSEVTAILTFTNKCKHETSAELKQPESTKKWEPRKAEPGVGAFLSFCHHGPGSYWERHTSSYSPKVLNSRDADVVPVMERRCCMYSIRYLKIFFFCHGVYLQMKDCVGVKLAA